MKFKTLAAAAFLIVMSAVPAGSQTLTVTVTGNGGVTGAGISCGSDCTEIVPMSISTRGARPGKVVLTAAGLMPASGPNWGGACQGTTGAVCTVTVTARGATVSARFGTLPDAGAAIGNAQDAMGGSSTGAPAPVIEGPGTISVSPGPTGLVYHAEPSGGASFVGWSGQCTGVNPFCTRSVGSTLPVKAMFGWPVTVIIEGPSGRVTGAGLDCPTNCSVVAVPPTLVLEATPTVASASFKEWGGDCQTAGSTTSGARCTLSLAGRKNVIARFQVNLPPPSP